MCGIAGFVGAGDRADLQRMTDALTHRGPDAEGHWIDAEHSLHLGHRRLSILDRAGGDQPMWNADRSLGVVFNGEIYNHAELRDELTACGHAFRSGHSDTEVLLHGYREWGRGLAERLNGMWAFALIDRRRKQLWLSRDRFGKKPLYYTDQPGTFAFASECSALLEHRKLQASLCPRALRKYFAYGYIPAPASIYREIKKLPGGCELTLDLASRRSHVSRSWQFELEPEEPASADAEVRWQEQIRELLAAAVRRRLVADVPVGIFLSGGIDSSAVAAMAVRERGRDTVPSFAIGFDEASFDESEPARYAAERLGTVHRQELLSVSRSREVLPELAAQLDEPMGDSSILPTYLLCGVARKQVTVALGGDGADELFAGYDPFRALRVARWYERLTPRPVHTALRMLAARLPTRHDNLSLDFRIKRTLRGLSHPPKLWAPVWMGPLDPGELGDLLQEPVDPEDVYSEAIEVWDSAPSLDLVDRTLLFYTRLYLQDDILTKVDRASMLHSLEVRSPFLDVDLVDLVRRIPSRFKLRGGQTKHLLKKSLEGVLPGDILYRPKKGFGVPIGRWFRDGGLGFEANGPPTAAPGVDAGRFLERKLQAHRRGDEDARLYLWNQWLLDRVVSPTGEEGN
jgi:asparagine synthase (glutamine-hydrolysing)